MLEGRNITPKKTNKTGYEVWFRVEMGDAVFAAPPQVYEPVSGTPAAPIKWNHE